MNKAVKFLFFFILAFSISSCKDKIETVYINPNKLLKGYHGAIANHEAFQTKAKVWNQRIDSLSTEMQALNTASSVTHASREQQLIHYRDVIQQQAQQENQRMTQVVLNEINDYIKQYGKKKGYTFILGATDSGNIVYAAEGTDVSDDVLKGLNAQYDRQHPVTSR